MRGPTRRELLDAAPPAALFVLGVVDLFVISPDAFRGPTALSLAFLAAVCAPLAFRRTRPALVLALVLLIASVWSLASYPGAAQPPFEPFVAGVVACFALGLHSDGPEFRRGLIAFGVLGAGLSAVSLALGHAAGNVLPALVWWSAAIGVGRLLHERQTKVDVLGERSARLERDRERDIAQAALEERARIGRELHDVIAHSVSLIVIQAAVERRTLEAGQERTSDVLETIEDAGREALVELRRLLGVLRASETDEPLAPQPGLSALPELLSESRKAGQSITCRTEGDPVPLAVGLDLTAYRIVQEALTNARKHAPGARADVTLRWRPAELEIDVLDDGPVATLNGHGTGHGLIGMRERAALFGGSLEADTVDSGGFRVRAKLPIEPGWRA